MDNLSRTSLPLPEGRDTMDVYLDDRQETERRLLELQSELRLCKQTISTLSCVNSDDNAQKLIDLASENSKIREELDSLLVSKENAEIQNREALQRKNDEINEVKRQLAHTEADRDRYLRRCQELEQRLAEEESRFYQQELDGRTTTGGEPRSNQEDDVNEGQKEASEHSTIGELPSTIQQERVQQKITQLAHENSQLNSIFDKLDQTDALAISAMNETQAAADQLEKHAKRLAVHNTGLIALYDQLKHTARFLGQIVKAAGLNSSQVDLLMQKIDQLQLDIQENNEVSVQIMYETKQLANEMSQVSSRIEQSVRQSISEATFQPNAGQNPLNMKAFDELLAKKEELMSKNEELLSKNEELLSKNEELLNKKEELLSKNEELIEKDKLLSDEIEDLKRQFNALKTDNEKSQSHVISLKEAKRELFEKLDNAMKMVQERDDELQNRQEIIQQLKEMTSVGNYNQAQPSEELKDEIEDQLRRIYDTLYAVSHKAQK